MIDDPSSSSGNEAVAAMQRTLKFTNVIGVKVTSDKNIEIVGQVDGGYVTFELPGKASAILSAIFSAYACELGVGGREEAEHSNLFLVGYEMRPPKDGMLPVLLKCKPDLHLWFTIPEAAVEDIGKDFISIATIIREQEAGSLSPDKS